MSADYWNSEENTGHELASAIFDTARAIVADRSGLRQKWMLSLRRYLDTADVRAVDNSDLGIIDYTAMHRADAPQTMYSKYNLCRMLPDALISRITLRQPFPSYHTRNAPEDVQAVARASDRFVRAEMEATKADQKGRRALRLRTIFGTDFTKVWGDKGTKQVEARVYGPDRVVIDNEGASADELPPALFHIERKDKGSLAAMFPGDDDASVTAKRIIEEAPVVSAVQGIRRSVDTIEAYMLPGPWGPGRRVIALANGVIVDVPFKRDGHVFIAGRYTPPADGFLGDSLIDEIVGIQFEIDAVFERIAATRQIFGEPYFERDPQSLIKDADLKVARGKVLPPGLKVVMPPGISPQDLEYLEAKKREGFEVSGMNMLAATATKPTGLDSGRALQVYNDTQTQRYSEKENDHAQWRVDYGEAVIEAGKDLHRMNVYRKRQGEDIELLADADMKRYSLHVAPASALSNEPAGRQAQLESAYRDGAITLEQYRSNLGYIEIEKDLELASAPRQLIQSMIEDMLSGKITDETYEEPDHPLDLAAAIEMSAQYWARAKDGGAEQDRLDLVARFWTDCRQKLEAKPLAPPVPATPDNLAANPDVAQGLAEAAALAPGGGVPQA